LQQKNSERSSAQVLCAAAYPIFEKSGRGRKKDGLQPVAVKNLLNRDAFSSIM
jgi:hypothetical protein